LGGWLLQFALTPLGLMCVFDVFFLVFLSACKPTKTTQYDYAVSMIGAQVNHITGNAFEQG
jgi:hypothetical protein